MSKVSTNVKEQNCLHKFDAFKYRSRGYKTFFLLNSVEHGILNAHKYKDIKKFGFFLGSGKPRMIFFPLINVKMPTLAF